MSITTHLAMQTYLIRKSKNAECSPLPSLVVCPPTLTGHWVYEVKKFVLNKYLNPLHYTGPPPERQRLRSKVKRYNLIIASYDIVRNDIDFFSTIRWNYCVLDEGHIIKNGKTKLCQAIKQLIANHRLILTANLFYQVVMRRVPQKNRKPGCGFYYKLRPRGAALNSIQIA
uniref:Helicase ATP-binding domain-containing protein n=1 Tax=Strigamia maritima TaxID=126957 RepID=T1JJZ5_STRMM